MGLLYGRAGRLPVQNGGLRRGAVGVGVTFAEPEIGALRTVGGDVDVHLSPYLFELLNGWQTPLVAAVGAGVGAAATIGVMPRR